MADTLHRLKAAVADRYAVERELGEGGMATVYLADDLRHDRQVAIKVLKAELASAIGPERFAREIKITARLQHTNILPLIDSGEADGFLYYVMPFIEGESLRDRLDRETQLPVDDILAISDQVASALQYAHDHDIVHRDIKPDNIMLSGDQVIVADFGIARAISSVGDQKLTETGLAIGTVTYMSPEQATGMRELDGRSDQYALGCMVYEMLAGQPPFTGPNVQSVVSQHLTAEPASVTLMRPATPPGAVAAVGRALAKTPIDRFKTIFGRMTQPVCGPRRRNQ